MDKLWAPWRITYLKKAGKEKGCLFCRAAEHHNTKKNFVFLKSRLTLAMLNIYPYNNGHAMVAPLRHVKALDGLNPDELSDIFECVKKARRILKRVLKPHGFNIGINEGRAAGAGIADHLHIHLVPRWKGDVNFMSVVSDTKVISQSLEALFKKLTIR